MTATVQAHWDARVRTHSVCVLLNEEF